MDLPAIGGILLYSHHEAGFYLKYRECSHHHQSNEILSLIQGIFLSPTNEEFKFISAF
jgi:hypothetical protein